MKSENIKVGIIGGSGMEDPAFITDYSTKNISTPYGPTSSELIVGSIENFPVVIISRHGKGHSINPTNVNYRANIHAMKEENCTHILAVTACGSLREHIKPGHFIFPDQFIDRTTKRVSTFFDGKDVQHISMANPFSSILRSYLVKICDQKGLKYHNDGTVVTIEGPRFSTKAESHMFRSWGCDIINMSTVPEVVLAKEKEIEYQAIAMSTDFDCWRESEDEVTMDMVYATMKKNVEKVKDLIKTTVAELNNNKGKNL